MVKGKISEENRKWCERLYSAQEVDATLFQMHPLKSSGPDGMPTLFFQKYWHFVGQDVKKMVLEVLNNNKDPTELNGNFIALIPKGKNTKTPKDFKPISLCNVVMKLVTKTIVNRIK